MPTYSERTEVDDVRCNPQTGYLGWRVTTIIERDGLEISRAYHRHSVEADSDEHPGAPSIPPEVSALLNIAVLHSPGNKAKARARRGEAGPPKPIKVKGA